MGDERYRGGRNAEGYKDPTASAAIENITKEERDADRRAGLLLRILKDLFALGGFHSLVPAKIRDRRTGREYMGFESLLRAKKETSCDASFFLFTDTFHTRSRVCLFSMCRSLL